MSLHGFSRIFCFGVLAAKQRIAVYMDKVAPSDRSRSKTNIHLGGYNGCC